MTCLLQTVLFYVFGIFFFIISETFFLRNTFSEVTFCLERKDFFEPDFCVFFPKSCLFSSKGMLLVL